MKNLACILVTRGTRAALVDSHILPSILGQGFGEVVVVGTHHEGDGYRYLNVPSVTGTTVDALIKRDVGAVATAADALLYLSDDHLLLDGWAAEWERWHDQPWDVLVPARYAVRDGALVPINNGTHPKDPHAPYCAGHAGLFRRRVLRTRPWMAAPHDLFWDLGHSRQLLRSGYALTPVAGLAVLDIDPNPAEHPRHFVFQGGVPLD